MSAAEGLKIRRDVTSHFFQTLSELSQTDVLPFSRTKEKKRENTAGNDSHIKITLAPTVSFGFFKGVK